MFQREIGGQRDGTHREIGSVRDKVGALRHQLRVEVARIENKMVTGEQLHHEISLLEKKLVTGKQLQRELGAVRVEIAKIPFETVKWLLALAGIAAAIATTVYNIWFG